MMKFPWRFGAVLCPLFLAAQLRADVYSSALQKAHNVTEQNNARQGNIAGQTAPPPAPAPAPAPQQDAILAATLSNITNLEADLATLQADPGRKQPLINDLNAAALGSRPSNETTTKLAQDLASLLSGRTLPLEQLRKVAQALHAFCNSSHLTGEQQTSLLQQTEKILRVPGSEVADSKIQLLDTNLRAVITATK